MSLLGNRRRKKSRAFEILIVPQRDGGGTKNIKVGGLKFALWGGVAFAVLFLSFFLAFRLTPLGRLVGVPAYQAGADSAEIETHRRISALAEEIGVLKDYNLQLRKALGERSEKEPSQPTNITREEPVQQSPDERQSTASAPEEFSPQAPATAQLVSTVEGLKASLPLFTPVSGVITQGFEPDQKHFGIDYAAKEGTPVHAAAQGYVVFSGWSYDYGNTLIASHGSGYITVYKHNSSLLKTTGARIKRGELIGLVGSSGKTSKGPHLHFEVLKDGVPVDPTQYLLNSKTAFQ